MSENVATLNFGCRLNIVETEAMRREALAAGHNNLVIVNTCAVTAEAVRQARQAIRRLARERPSATIVVTGCAAQTQPELFAAMPEVTRLIGNEGKANPGTWAQLFQTERVAVNDISSASEIAPHFLDGLQGHTRGFLQVQNGCDHRCTFCIIPYGRGPSRSAAMGDIVSEARKLVEMGVAEIVLTGVDLTSWGHDLPGNSKLGVLVQQILHGLPALQRLRLSSLDCIEVDEALFEVIAGEPRFMPHLHLSLQAGDDMILKRMKRRHTRAQSLELCAKIRELRPNIVFGADLIVGFPTEGQEMFANTLKLVEDCGLTHLHVFPFSPRQGTPAAKMPQVRGDIIKTRAQQLRAAGDAALQRHLTKQLGRELSVLMERGGTGHSADFTKVRVDGASAGTMAQVRIVAIDGDRLVGALA